MGKTKEFVAEVETHLWNIYKAIGIDRPENHEDILDFVVNDVIETAEPGGLVDQQELGMQRQFIGMDETSHFHPCF